MTTTKTRPARAEKPKRDERGRLLPGYTANPYGRTPGSRNRLSEAFIAALCADFVEHGAQAIQEMRVTDPGGYVKVIAALQPKQVEAEVTRGFEHMSNEELVEYITEGIVDNEAMLQAIIHQLEQTGDEEDD